MFNFIEKLKSLTKKTKQGKNKENAKSIVSSVIGLSAILLMILLALVFTFTGKNLKSRTLANDPETIRAMEYDVIQPENQVAEAATNCEYVKFDAFFLRDVNGDGYAEQLRGTCKEIGTSDMIFINFMVNTNGTFKDGKITINSQNFNLKTSMPKDNEIKENAIGNNVKQIVLNEIPNGTQKLLMGVVTSGNYASNSTKASAIGDNINNLSKINSITLTGTHVADNGTETHVEKTVYFWVDWYGDLSAAIPQFKMYSNYDFKNQESLLQIGEDDVTFDFTILTAETKNKLSLEKAILEMDVPQLNGYDPIAVTTENEDVTFTYDPYTRKIRIEKTAETDASGNIIKNAYDSMEKYVRYNEYGLKIIYPLEAYLSLNEEDFRMDFPIYAQYEGYNNPNDEFDNPKVSQIATDTITVFARHEILDPDEQNVGSDLDVKVGKKVYDPERYMVEKKTLLEKYSGKVSGEDPDRYTVTWYASTGTDCNDKTMILSPKGYDKFVKYDASTIDMGDFVTVKGIYLQNAEKMVGPDGYINVYDDDTDELLHSFTIDDWNLYKKSSPYYFDSQTVKNVRVETSPSTIERRALYVYLVKEIDDEYVLDNIPFADFQKINFIHSEVELYYTSTKQKEDYGRANYEAPASLADLRISPSAISNQITEDHQKIYIETISNDVNAREKWTDGTFLVKMPDEIIALNINDVSVNNNAVQVESYEVIEDSTGRYIKVLTRADSPTVYTITIDVDTTADPRMPTINRQVKLYYENDNCKNYINSIVDTYDINGNSLTDDLVGTDSVGLDIISPNALLTAQMASYYDNNGSVAIGPQIAVIDNEQRSAKIDLFIKNNQSDTISEVVLLGRIPSTDSEYVINGRSLESDFSTTMTNEGIIVPQELRDYVKVYYSENIDATQDLENPGNGWTQTPDFSKVKSYMIVLDEYVMPTDVTHTFSYNVIIPEGIDYNDVSYSHHAVFYCLDTAEGKFRTQAEPNKLGIMMTELYDLEITKYHEGKNILVPGATYTISEVGSDNTSARITNSEGKLLLKNLKAEKTYSVKEIRSPGKYKLNEQEIKFTTAVSENALVPTLISGTLRNGTQITAEKIEDENYKVKIQVEDEALGTLKIYKRDDRGISLANARFILKGTGFGSMGTTVTTDANGEITIDGIHFGEEYELKETKAEGYYLLDPIKFVVTKTGNSYSINVTEGYPSSTNIVTGDFPVIEMTLENETMPTFNLNIHKIESVENTPLANAVFQLIKDGKIYGEYTTDANGNITINDLPISKGALNDSVQYSLKEIQAPSGYVRASQIDFELDQDEDGLYVMIDDETNYSFVGGDLTIEVVDCPKFRLTKVDGTTNEPLPGTKFAIYNVENEDVPAVDEFGNFIGEETIIDGRKYYLVTTDAGGNLVLDLPVGLYKAVEVVPSSTKYEVDNEPYYFGIGAERETEKQKLIRDLITLGGTGSDGINAAVENSNNDRYVVGYFNDSAAFGDIILSSNGSSDAFIAKYDSNGEIVWARSFGTENSESFAHVIQLDDGGIVAAGTITSNIVIEGQTYTCRGSQSGLLIKFDENGNIIWVNVVGGANESLLTFLKNGNNGNFIIGGRFNSSLSLTSGSTGLYASTYDGYFLEIDPDGNCINKIQVRTSSSNDSGTEEVHAATRTSDNGYIFAGKFGSSQISIGSLTLTKTSGDSTGDSFIVKVDEDFNPLWLKTISTQGLDNIITMDLMSNGDIAVGGYVNWTYTGVAQKTCEFTLMGTTYTVSSKRPYVVRMDQNGDMIWGKLLPAGEIYDVTVIEDDAVSFFTDFNSSSNTIEGLSVSRYSQITYDVDGNLLEAKGFNSGMSLRSMQMGNDNKLIITGSVSNGTSIGSYNVNTNGGYDGYCFVIEEIGVPEFDLVNQLHLGTTKKDEFSKVVATKDGGYITIFHYFEPFEFDGELITHSSQTNYANSLVIKYDENENIEWKSVFTGYAVDEYTDICETSDGGFIAVGYCWDRATISGTPYSRVPYSQLCSGIVVKYDANGNVLWVKYLGLSGDNVANSTKMLTCAPTNDGGAVVGGYYKNEYLTVNGVNLDSYGDVDAMLFKLSSTGTVEWGKSFGTGGTDRVTDVALAPDGNVIVVGYFSGTLTLDNKILKSNGSFDGLMFSVNPETGKIKWARNLGTGDTEEFTNVAVDSEGYIYIIGEFSGTSCTLDNIEFYTGFGFSGSSYKFVAKFSPNGVGIWGHCHSMNGTTASTDLYDLQIADNGVLVAGGSSTNGMIFGEYTFSTKGAEDQILIFYDEDGVIKFFKSWGGTSNDYLYSATKLNNGSIVTAGSFYNSYTVGDNTITSNGGFDGVLNRFVIRNEVKELNEIEVHNKIKEYRITTDVDESGGVKGGTISGEKLFPYEKVIYNESNVKEIVVTPEEGYKIASITVNGEEVGYTENADGSYTMPTFVNMKEDKHIVVRFADKEKGIIINKVDSVTGEKLEGAKLEIRRVEERTEPSDELGSLTDNGPDTTILVKGEEDTTFNYTLQNNGDYYFAEKNGEIIPTNGLAYTDTAGVPNSTADSVVEIDLENKTGSYLVEVSMTASSEANYDFGYAILKNELGSLATSDFNNAFIKVAGKNVTQTASTPLLEGGNKYYLHLAYKKDGSTDGNDDKVVINSVKLYNTTTSIDHFHFTESSGLITSTNGGVPNSIAASYIPIDLTGKEGKYEVSFKYAISSENSDYGYVYLTNSDAVPDTSSATDRIIATSGSSNYMIYKKKSVVLDGGSTYYLHFLYKKNATTDTGTDKFFIKQVQLNLYNTDYINDVYTTNAQGQILLTADYGVYEITEIEAPEGYKVDDTVHTIEFSGEGNEFDIPNEKLSKVIVHHYLKGTTTQVAPDDNYEGTSGEDYSTEPHLDLVQYELAKDALGEYIMPNNHKGQFEHDDIVVTYYYEEQNCPLIVHHYIKGTNIKVTKKDGTPAADEEYSGRAGDPYTTNAISPNDLDEYELAETPSNSSGTYSNDITEVTYYYKLVSRPVTIQKTDLSGSNMLSGAVFEIGKDIALTQEVNEYTTNAQGQININLPKGIYYVREKIAPTGYEANAEIKSFEIKNDTEQINLEFKDDLEKGRVIVHHYIEGTNIPITDVNDQDVEAEVKTGYIGNRFATKPYENKNVKYKLVGNSEPTYGEYNQEEQEVIYEYRLVRSKVIVHHYIDGTTTPVPLPDGNNAPTQELEGTIGETYETTSVTPDERYELVSTPANATGTYGEDDITVNYYYKLKDTSVLVHYYIEGTSNPVPLNVSGQVAQDVLINGTVGDSYTTTPITNQSSDYQLISSTPADYQGNMTVNQIVVTYYYRLKDTSVVVHHYLLDNDGNTTTNKVKDPNGVDIPDETYDGRIGDHYSTSAKSASEIASKYELVTSMMPDNATGTMTEAQIVVIYYYKLKDTSVLVHHYIQGTTTKVPNKTGGRVNDVTITGHVDDPYTTVEASNKADYYELVSEPINKSGTMTENQIVVTYYYKLKQYPYVVNYIEKDVGTVLSPQKQGAAQDWGTEIASQTEVITINGYRFSKADINGDESKDTLTISENANNNVINIYYEKRNDLSYTVHYKEKDTNATLRTDKVVNEKTFGDVIQSSSEVIAIDGYNYDSVDKATLTIGTGTNEITIYYTKRTDLSYTVNYLEKGSNRVLQTAKTVTGRTFGETIDATAEKISITGYNFDSLNVNGDFTENTLVITTSDNIINIYYTRRNDLSYEVNYLEKGTNAVLQTKKTQDGMTFGDVVDANTEKISINGYRFDSLDVNGDTTTDSLIIGVNANVINIYYTKRTDLSYTVHYKEKGTNATLHTDKTVNNQTYNSVITSSNEVIAITGYNYDSVDKATLTIGTGTNEITIYYTKRADLSYTINYLEKDTNDVLHESKVQGGMTYQSIVKASDEVIAITGYNYDSCDKDQITIDVNASNNVINLYYTKVSGLAYTVNYLDKDTSEAIHEPKVEDDKTYGDVIQSSDEVIAIDGYNYDSVDKASLTISVNNSENVINIYYTKRTDLSYTVHYKEKGTNNTVHDDKTVNNQTFNTVITSSNEVITINGYNYDSVDKETLTIGTGTNEITIYYTKRADLSYTVHYKEKGTNATVHTDKVVNNQTFNTVITSSNEVITIDGYNYDSVDKATLTIGTGSNEITIYYTKRTDLSYTVHYKEKGSNATLHTDKVVNNQTYNTVITSSNEVIAINGYNYDSVDKETLTIGTGSNEITIYYTKRTDLSYTVHYKDKNSNESIYDDKVVNNQTYQTVITSSNEVIDIVGYTYDSVDKDTLTIGTGTNEITIFYVKRNDLSYTVNYLELGTNNVVHAQKIQTGVEYLTQITGESEVITINGYNYNSLNINGDATLDTLEVGVNPESNVINIYYTKVSGLSYTVNYLDKQTGESIHPAKVESNRTFEEEILAEDERITIDGYTYDSLDVNGDSSKDKLIIGMDQTQNIINIYYNKRTDLSYTVKYLEKGTNAVLHTPKTVNNQTYNAVINSSDEVITINGYNYDSVDKATLTIGTGTNEITIYYTKRTDLSYTVHYKEKGTNNTLHVDKVVNNQTYNSVITSSDEVITIDGYNYDSVDKATLTIGTGSNEITIYYTKRTDLSYTVHYKEKTSNETLHADKVVNNQTYQAVITSSDEVITIDGYNYDSVDKETLTIGTGSNEITVFYTKRTDLSYTVHYKEKGTNTTLHDDKTVNNQTYQAVITSSDEVIAIDGYNYDSVDKATLTIGTGSNEITIYYTKRTDLSYTVNYYEKVGTQNVKIHDTKNVSNQTFGNIINTADEIIDIPGYTFDYAIPADNITITTGTNVIDIFYSRVTGISYTVNYLEEGTNTKIVPSSTTGDMTYGDVINTSDEIIQIDGYNYVRADKDSLTIGVNENENFINLYYTKRSDLSYTVHYKEKGTNNTLHTDKVVNNQVFDTVINSSDEVIAINGYNYDSVDKETLTITTGTNEITIYYTKRTDLSYTVHYKEKTTNNTLHEDKVVNNQTYETVINSNDEIISINGYNYDSVDKATLTIGTGANEITVFYTKRNDLSYTVHYKEKTTNNTLHTDKVVNNQTFETVINSSDEVISIDGYNYDSVDKATLTIGTGTNEITIYYTKRTDLSYTVHYKEKTTNNTIHVDKVANNQTFESVIISSNEVIDIDGYYYDSVDKDTLTITTGTNEITIYYVKRNDLRYTVNYLEKDTNRVIHDPKVQSGVTFNTEVVGLNEVITINGYNYDSLDVAGDATKDTLVVGTTIESNVINIYYTKASGLTYTVNYLEKTTGNRLYPAKVESNRIFEEEIVAADERIVIDGYIYDSLDVNGDGSKDTLIIGTDPANNVINIYYTKRTDLSYTVHYKEKTTNNTLHEDKVVQNQTFETVINSSDEVIQINGYNYDSVDKETLTITTGTNEITVYYTKRTDLSYTVHYKEKGTNNTLHVDKVVPNQTFEAVINSNDEIITIDGYNYDSVDKATLTIGTGSNEITIYYTKRTDLSYTVHYKEKGTNLTIHEDKVVPNQTFEAVINSNDEVITIDGYNYDSVDKATLTITTGSNEITIYYTKRTDLSYTVHYKEKTTNNTLHEDKVVNNKTYQEVITSSNEVITINGYNYDSVDKETLTIGTGVNEITIYYTKRNDLSYTVHYKEKGTNYIIHEDKVVPNQVFETVITSTDEVIPINGYNFDSVDKDTLTIGTGLNEITVYYTRVTGISYTVNYLEQGSNERINPSKVTGDMTFGDVVNTQDEIIQIDGYNYISADKDTLTIGTNVAENVINLYYGKRTDLSYTVHYKEKTSNNTLHEDKVVGNQTFETVINSQDEIIEINGYNYDSVDKDTLAITTGTNEMTIYYTKRNDLSYTVHYKEKTTNNTLHVDKVAPNQVFETVINAQDEIIDIDGYNYDSVDKDNLVIGTGSNEITVYYTKRTDLSYTVHYKEKTTNNTLHEDKVVGNQTFETVINSSTEVIDINGYNYDSVDKDTLTITTGTNEITIYYTKRNDLSYTVHYKEKGTNETLHEDKVALNQTFETVINSQDEVIDIEGYNFDSADRTTLTIGTGTNEMTLFYTKKNDLQYRVNYLEKDTNKVLSEQKIVNTARFEDTILAVDEIITIRGYDFDSFDKEFITIKVDPNENIINLYYTKRVGLGYTVNYLDKDTNRPIQTPKTASGKTFEDVVVAQDEVITIYGYNYDSSNVDELVISDVEEENVINLYYTRREGKVTAHYYEEGTTNKVAEDNTYTGLVNDTYETEESTRIPDKYELVAEPMNKTGVYTEDDIDVIYYYRKKATKVIVHHLEDPTTNGGLYVLLTEDEELPYRVDDEYETHPSNNVPVKYEVVDTKLPSNATGTATLTPIEVTYYYKVRDGIVNIRYVDRYNNEEIASREQQTGKVDERYIVTEKTIPGYTYVSNSGNAEGTIAIDPTLVTFYYAKNVNITVNHIDITNNNILGTDTQTDKKQGDTYETSSRDFTDYILVQTPSNATGTVGHEDITVNYYYVHVSGGLIEKHIDVISGDVLYNELHEGGNEGDEYNVDPRTFAEYDLVEDRLPANAHGRLTPSTITVTYYYIRRANIVVKYVERYSNTEIPNPNGTPSRETISGHENDPYSTVSKTFDGYVLEAMPANATGNMPAGTTEIIYYYRRTSGGVTVNHIDQRTGLQLADEARLTGYVGDDYTTEPLNLSNYDLVAMPSNATGKFKVEQQNITYYYKQKASVTVRYVDQATGKDIIDSDGNTTKEIIPGYVGDDFTSDAKYLNGYVLVSEPDNKSGTMTEEPIELIYTYRKLRVNLSVEKIINTIKTNGIEEEINGPIGKTEIYRKEVKGQSIRVTYTIKVVNDGEVEMEAVLRDEVPSGMRMNQELNPGWRVTDNIATLETDIIQPGETREYRVILDWEEGDNIGTKTNKAEIVTTNNKYGLPETDLTDNESEADTIIAISTGGINYVFGAGALLVMMSAIGITFIRVKNKRRMEW